MQGWKQGLGCLILGGCQQQSLPTLHERHKDEQATDQGFRQPGLIGNTLCGFHQDPAGQTGHNSGVIHSGIYYQPGSLKAVMCRAARDSMVAFAQAHDIADWRATESTTRTFIDAIAEGRDADPWGRRDRVPVPEAVSEEGPAPIVLIATASV